MSWITNYVTNIITNMGASSANKEAPNLTLILLLTGSLISFFYSGWGGQPLLVAVIIGILISAFCLLIFEDNQLKFPNSLLSKYFVVFLLTILVLYFFSTIPRFSFYATWEISLLPICFWSYTLYFKKNLAWETLFTGLFLGAIFCACWGLIDFYSDIRLNRIPYVNGPLLDPNVFAAILNAILLLAIYYFITASNLKTSCFFGIGIFILTTVILLTSSRGVVLISLMQQIFLLLVFFFRSQHSRSKITVWATISICALLSFQLLYSFIPNRQNNDYDFSAISNADDSTWTIRQSIWSSVYENYQSHNKLTGVGLGTYSLYYPSTRKLEDSITTGKRAHNDYVEALNDGGLIFTGLLLIIVLILIFYFFHVSKIILFSSRTNKNNEPILNLTLIIVMLGFALHACINFIFYAMPTLLLFAIFLAKLNFNLNPKKYKTYFCNTNKNLQRAKVVFCTALFMLYMPLAIDGVIYSTLSTYSGARDTTKLKSRISDKTAYKIAELGVIFRPSNQSSRVVMNKFLKKIYQTESNANIKTLIDTQIRENYRAIIDDCLKCTFAYRELANFELSRDKNYNPIPLFEAGLKHDPWDVYSYIDLANYQSSAGLYTEAITYLMSDVRDRLPVMRATHGDYAIITFYEEVLDITINFGPKADQQAIARELIQLNRNNKRALKVLATQ